MNDTGAAEILLLVLFAVACIVPTILYLLSLQKCLTLCSPEVRAMSPGMVWLLFIPLFNIVWQFFVVINIAKSVQGEFQKRGLPCEPNPGQAIGLAMCILAICGIIPLVGIVASLAGLVCWIIYWVKVAGFSAQLSVPTTATAA